MLSATALLLAFAFHATPPPPSVIIWGGGKMRADAERALKTWKSVAADSPVALAEGYPRIIESKTWTGLKPGFLIVVLGVCDAKSSAGVVSRLKPDNPGVYARVARGLSEPRACPQPIRARKVKAGSLDAARAHPVVVPEGFTTASAPEVVSAQAYDDSLPALFARDTATLVGWDTCAGGDTSPEGEPIACASGEELRVFRGKRLVLQLPRAADASDVECSYSLSLQTLETVEGAKGEPPRILATWEWSDGGCAALYAGAACEEAEGPEARAACLEALPAAQREERTVFTWRDGRYVSGPGALAP